MCLLKPKTYDLEKLYFDGNGSYSGFGRSSFVIFDKIPRELSMFLGYRIEYGLVKQLEVSYCFKIVEIPPGN